MTTMSTVRPDPAALADFLTSQGITEQDVGEMFEECDVIGQSFSRSGHILSKDRYGYRLAGNRDERWPSWMGDTQDA